MEYAATDLNPRDRYKILTAFVLPRPIALIPSVGTAGVVNVAHDGGEVAIEGQSRRARAEAAARRADLGASPPPT